MDAGAAGAAGAPAAGAAGEGGREAPLITPSTGCPT